MEVEMEPQQSGAGLLKHCCIDRFTIHLYFSAINFSYDHGLMEHCHKYLMHCVTTLLKETKDVEKCIKEAFVKFDFELLHQGNQVAGEMGVNCIGVVLDRINRCMYVIDMDTSNQIEIKHDDKTIQIAKSGKKRCFGMFYKKRTHRYSNEPVIKGFSLQPHCCLRVNVKSPLSELFLLLSIKIN
jgi:hypothetical protein